MIIFQENVSFDHYFATYPYAMNPPGEPTFHAASRTPNVNGLTFGLLTSNPNLNPLNLAGAGNAFRSIIHFIEDNWLGGKRIGQGSFDTIANSLVQMFDFNQDPSQRQLFLDPATGEVIHVGH